MSGLFFTIYMILSCLGTIESYHGVSLTGLPAYVTRGQTILPRCIIRTNNLFAPNSIRQIFLSANGRRVEQFSESAISWRFDSNTERKVREFSHIYTVNEDTTFKCTVIWKGRDDDEDDDENCKADCGCSCKEAVFTVPVGCPLKLESQSTLMDTISEEYGVNIVVSGKDVGPRATIVPPSSLNSPKKSPMTLIVTSRVIPGVYHLGQKEATLFSVRWKLNPDWDTLCQEEKAQADWDYTLKVPNAYDAGTTLPVKFKVQYPAIWVKAARRTFTISENNSQNLTLRCSVCALPQASLMWTFCGAEVPHDVIFSQSGAELTIPQVSDNHLGTYQCIATNVVDKKQLRKTFHIGLSFNNNPSGAKCGNANKAWLYACVFIIFIIIIAIGIVIAFWKREEIKDILVHRCGTPKVGCPKTTRRRRNKIIDSRRDVPLKALR